MKVSCVLLVNDPCRQLQDRFTPPARPWFASGGGHMSWKPFVVGVDASPEAAGAAAFACRVAEQAGAGCRLVPATRDVLAAFEGPEEIGRAHVELQSRLQPVCRLLLGKKNTSTQA